MTGSKKRDIIERKSLSLISKGSWQSMSGSKLMRSGKSHRGMYTLCIHHTPKRLSSHFSYKPHTYPNSSSPPQ